MKVDISPYGLVIQAETIEDIEKIRTLMCENMRVEYSELNSALIFLDIDHEISDYKERLEDSEDED